MIRDQRHVEGFSNSETPESLRTHWDILAARIKLRHFNTFPESERVDFEQRTDSVIAYVNDNRWVADCPECGGGMMTWVGNPNCACFDCGSIWKVTFPPTKTMSGGIQVLLARPQHYRNWKPDVETVDDLKVENITRGYPLKPTEVIQ